MNTPKLGYLEITPKPGADLLHTITAIIQHAIDKGEHGSPAAVYAREVLAAVESYYDEKRDSLFNRRGLTRLARQS